MPFSMWAIPTSTAQPGPIPLTAPALLIMCIPSLATPLNRSSRDQVKNGVAISKEDLQQGDLVFFSTNGQYPTHVGLYIGDNNIVHASTPQDGVKISSLDTSYYMDNYFAARRIL